MATNIKRLTQNVFAGTGAPATGDLLVTENSVHPSGSIYFNIEDGSVYVRSGTSKVVGDWKPHVSSGASTVYIALLTQTGENAPVATVLKNTLGVTPVWARAGIGEYTLTSG